MKKNIAVIITLAAAVVFASCNPEAGVNPDPTPELTPEQIAWQNEYLSVKAQAQELVGTWRLEAVNAEHHDPDIDETSSITFSIRDTGSEIWLEFNKVPYISNKNKTPLLHKNFFCDYTSENKIANFDLNNEFCNGEDTLYFYCSPGYQIFKDNNSFYITFITNDSLYDFCLAKLVPVSNGSGSSAVEVVGNYSIQGAINSSFTFSDDGTWTYSYLSSSKSGTYEMAGNEITLYITNNGYQMSETYTTSKSNTQLVLTRKRESTNGFEAVAFMISDYNVISSGVVTFDVN